MPGEKTVHPWRQVSILLAVAVCCKLPESGAEVLRSELFASGLVRPLFVTFAPGDADRVFVVQKTGQIRIVLDGVLLETPFLNIATSIRATGSEQGLLGLAFHPNYSGDPKEPGFGEFFVNYTDSNGDTVVARFSVSDDPNLAEPTGTTVITYAQPQTNHNGGWMAFGPGDGFLYISSGDGGGANDDSRFWPGHTPDLGNGQDITKLLGKMLRIDVDGDDFPADDDRNYAIPSTNPFVGVTGADEIWAYGLRNPWRCAFDPLTHDLYIADVGQGDIEEISFQRAAGAGGENYGWRCMEGSSCTGLSGCTCFDDALTDPFHEYTHDGTPQRCSVTGGEVYRGSAMPALQGTYFFGDYCSGQIWSVRYDGTTMSDFRERTCELQPEGTGAIANISSFGRDADGELYVCALFGGNVFKILPAAGIVSSMPPDGAIDARRPSDMDGANPVGWNSVELSMDIALECMTNEDFAVTQEGGSQPPPDITDTAFVAPGRVRLTLDRAIEIGAWTTIEHLPSGASVRLGYLPGDVDGNAMVTTDDIHMLLAAIRGAGGPAQAWSIDLDRSGRLDQLELITLLDLMVGAGAFEPYFGAELP